MIIEKQNYAPYFLTVHDIVCYANDKEILCQGRGSAANSAVCYAHHAVDPLQITFCSNASFPRTARTARHRCGFRA